MCPTTACTKGGKVGSSVYISHGSRNAGRKSSKRPAGRRRAVNGFMWRIGSLIFMNPCGYASNTGWISLFGVTTTGGWPMKPVMWWKLWHRGWSWVKRRLNCARPRQPARTAGPAEVVEKNIWRTQRRLDQSSRHACHRPGVLVTCLPGTYQSNPTPKGVAPQPEGRVPRVTLLQLLTSVHSCA